MILGFGNSDLSFGNSDLSFEIVKVFMKDKYLWKISIYELGVDETERSSWLKPDPPDLLPLYLFTKTLGRGTTQPPTTPGGKMKI